MAKKFLKFPDNFLWGTATSAYQIEGNCNNNDWSHQALKKYSHKISWAEKVIHDIPDAGIACDSWQRYQEDIQLAKQLNTRLYRFSLEWSKIEPHNGKFDQSALDHYKKVLQQCKQDGFKVMLTLHHFTNPIWTAEFGGWEKKIMVKYFLRYVKKVVTEFGDLVDFWVTINEPGGYAFLSYKLGRWVPLKTSQLKMMLVFKNLVQAHKKAYKLIHKIVKDKFNQSTQVGIANDLQAYSNYRKHSLWEQLKVYYVYNFSNHLFYKLSNISTHDFLGVNYYFEVRTHKQISSKIKHDISVKHELRHLTDTDWVIYPRGIYDVLYDLSDYHKPIYITENGIATQNDEVRIRFIKEHLEEIYYAIQAGIDIRGYCYWSLLDNFEWAEGYKPKFGLISVDPKTHDRQLKSSADFYAKISKENGLWWHY